MRSRAWPGSCRRPCSGAPRRCDAVVRGRQVRLAVAVQVADRDRAGWPPACVVELGLEAAVAPVQEHGDAVRVECSRSPGPACRRRSGRRSRPRRVASGCVVALGPEAAVAPVQEHGDGGPRRVRGRQVRLAVAVQVADRDRDRAASGSVAPGAGERRRRRAGDSAARRPSVSARPAQTSRTAQPRMPHRPDQPSNRRPMLCATGLPGPITTRSSRPGLLACSLWSVTVRATAIHRRKMGSRWVVLARRLLARIEDLLTLRRAPAAG